MAYYGHLFGFHNLLVLDNGSELAEVQATLAEFEGKGVTVDRSYANRADYEAKGDIVGAQIARLDQRREYDFIIPLDCDEFIVLRGQPDLSCSHEAITTYLKELVGETRVLRVPYQLANHPLQPDIYHYFTFHKVFFAAGTFAGLDQGFHVGQSRAGDGIRDTRLIHLHFHHKRFDLMMSQARKTWIGTVDLDDRDKLVGYKGHSMHLAPMLLNNKEQYYRNFVNRVHFVIPEFRSLLASLGAPLDLPSEPVGEDLLVRILQHNRVPPIGSGSMVLVPQKSAESNEFSLQRFDEQSYLAANPDVIAAGIDPTVHFCTNGFREGRSLRPTPGTVGGALPGNPSLREQRAVDQSRYSYEPDSKAPVPLTLEPLLDAATGAIADLLPYLGVEVARRLAAAAVHAMEEESWRRWCERKDQEARIPPIPYSAVSPDYRQDLRTWITDHS